MKVMKLKPKYTNNWAIVDGHKISYFIRDNKVSETIVFVHGFNASAETVEMLWENSKNYNVIAINLPGSKYSPTKQKLTIDFFIDIVDKFISNHIKTKKIILIGHSLGGGVVLGASSNEKVKKLFFVSTINPEMVNGKLFKWLRNVHSNVVNPNSNASKIKSRVFQSMASTYQKLTNNIWIQPFYDSNSPYYSIISDYLINDKYMTQTLSKQYLNLKKPSYFIIGDNDIIVETDGFIKFVEAKLNKKPYIIKDAGHNPFKNGFEINEILEKYIKYKRRSIFKRKIIKS